MENHEVDFLNSTESSRNGRLEVRISPSGITVGGKDASKAVADYVKQRRERTKNTLASI